MTSQKQQNTKNSRLKKNPVEMLENKPTTIRSTQELKKMGRGIFEQFTGQRSYEDMYSREFYPYQEKRKRPAKQEFKLFDNREYQERKETNAKINEIMAQIKQEISSILNQKIVAPWQEIFPGPNKNIIIETGNDQTGYFIQLKVNEGTSPFLINERSLGFRWFFGFILFTEFRKARADESGEYLFLFDEPASNLHESSQQKLLSLFEKLIDKSKIIYSTHSPYLINPKFILNCFIVKDTGRENSNDYDFRQNIKAIHTNNLWQITQMKKLTLSPFLMF